MILQESQESLLPLSALHRGRSLQPRRGHHQNLPGWHPGLGLAPTPAVRNKCVLFRSCPHPVYGTLLWQSRLTKTEIDTSKDGSGFRTGQWATAGRILRCLREIGTLRVILLRTQKGKRRLQRNLSLFQGCRNSHGQNGGKGHVDEVSDRNRM